MTQSVADLCREYRERWKIERGMTVHDEHPRVVINRLLDIVEAQSAVVSQAQEVWNGLGKSRTFADALSGLGTALKSLHALSEKRDE